MRRVARTGLNYAGIGLLALALGLLLYAGILHWLGREFALAALDVTRDQAEVAADQVQRVLPAAALQHSLNALNSATELQIRELLFTHPNILTVVIADGSGRIIFSSPGSSPAALKIWREVFNSRMLRGTDIAGIPPAVHNHAPDDTVEVTRNIGTPPHPKGTLLLFVDPATPQDLVLRARGHMGRDLVPLLVLALALCGMILWWIARQRRIAARLRRQRDQAEGLAHVGTLAAGLAHEIRNPVNALTMQLEMLEEDAESGDRTQLGVRVERIRAGLANLERTVHEFLSFAMPERQRPAQLDLAVELQGLVAAVQMTDLATATGGAPEVTLKVAADLTGWCDAHAFRQIVTNLLTNALRVQRQQAQPKILVEAYRESNRIVVAVEDAGPGVPPENRAQIFEAFFTTQPDGTGLGLPIARRLAMMNGGMLSLAAKAALLPGARLELHLPLTASGAQAE